MLAAGRPVHQGCCAERTDAGIRLTTAPRAGPPEKSDCWVVTSTRTGAPAVSSLLGSAEDKVIAARLGRTRTAVLQHPRILGIPPTPRVFPKAWTAEQELLLGKAP